MSYVRTGGIALVLGILAAISCGCGEGPPTGPRADLPGPEFGVSGTFSSLKAAPNVFLDASLSYNANNVFLDINRINVASAIAGMSPRCNCTSTGSATSSTYRPARR